MDEDRAPIWTLGGIAIFFKILAVVLVIWYDGSRQAIEMAIAINWPFFIPLLLATPILVWWIRLLRVRMKRRKLIEQEWKIRVPEKTVGRGR